MAFSLREIVLSLDIGESHLIEVDKASKVHTVNTYAIRAGIKLKTETLLAIDGDKVVKILRITRKE